MKLNLTMLLAIAGLAICGCEDEQNTTVNEAPQVVATNEVNDLPDVTIDVPGSNNHVNVQLPKQPAGTNGVPVTIPDIDISVPGDNNDITVRAAREFDRQRRAIEKLGI